ncbi:hypothetical protein CV726_01810 [Helicobacter pylori]|uniref:hypothetical protein n=1 Tax=Helicobacter pylori TaxID=210 RepID=UPI0011989958|nr:hypothetical protein CV726_01810 [Helicobacter pylori]
MHLHWNVFGVLWHKAFFFFCHFLKNFVIFCFFALPLNAFNWILKTLLTLLQPMFNKNRAKIKQD